MSESPLIPIDQVLPHRILIIGLEGRPIFPGIFSPIMITSQSDIETVEEAMSTTKMVGFLLTRNGEEPHNPTRKDYYDVGTVAKIVKKINLPDGGVNIFVSTIQRFRVMKFQADGERKSAIVEYPQVKDEDTDSMEIKALVRSILSEVKQLSENNPLFSEEIRLNLANIDQPNKLSDFLAGILNLPRDQQQDLLETFSVRQRLEKVLIAIHKELELAKLQRKISHQINERIEKNQREYFLREELKAIQRELGITTDAKGSDYQKFKEKIESFQFEGEIKETVESELEKFNLMDPNSSEYIVTRNYLDTIIKLPWKDPPPEEIDLAKAERILNKDHYGLEDVKERILEFIAVRKLKKDSKGSILCLIGPPGVGKTSIGKSIARALDRPFFRFSVGGMRDEAEIKGHRRTYVGALPGKIIQGLKITGSKRPVFMIDEIDKLAEGYQGDPSSALLEVLDPEQNVSFRDHYLDLPFDISRILFIATANTFDSIPRPLLDRMEVIRLSGYIEEEKVAIATRYLIPKSEESHGLPPKQVKFSRVALTQIINGFAREAGVRNLEKAINKIHRKLASKFVKNQITLPLIIQPENLNEYLGKPFYPEEHELAIDRPGMVYGLAWTSLGGSVLVIEAIKSFSKGGLKLTGRMGEVMRESALIAYSVVLSHAKDFNINPEIFEKSTIHLHIPEGATPKDGPSAGITMATCLLSLVRGKKVKPNFAMTGELSLTGKVMAIGGLKEKTIAARRHGIKNIIIPKSNLKDWEEIPEYVRKGLKVHPVERIEEVWKLVF
jgi:ATP-dependent Lon protease